MIQGTVLQEYYIKYRIKSLRLWTFIYEYNISVYLYLLFVISKSENMSLISIKSGQVNPAPDHNMSIGSIKSNSVISISQEVEKENKVGL